MCYFLSLFALTAPQGNRYWRFEGDVLDEDYPRDISVGFDNIPDDIDAAFAIPAPNHRGKEKAYFFKGLCDIWHYLNHILRWMTWQPLQSEVELRGLYNIYTLI